MAHEGHIRRLVDSLVDKLYAEGIFRNCTECAYWKATQEICGKYNQRPPAKVIVKGCPDYDELPF